MNLRTLIAAIVAACLPITACADPDEPANKLTDNMIINITIDGITKTANLADNSSARALFEKLQQSPLTYTANDYGDFEKVGSLGFSLPQNDRSVTTSPGDIILYQGNNLCLYYARNSWNFTVIGKINYQSESDLRDFLKAGKGQILVTLSLPKNSHIDDPEQDGNHTAVYYNLSGAQVGPDAKGILITKDGAKTKKIKR